MLHTRTQHRNARRRPHRRAKQESPLCVVCVCSISLVVPFSIKYWVQVVAAAGQGGGGGRGTREPDGAHHEGDEGEEGEGEGDEGEGVPLHYDKDELLLRRAGVWRHPALSTVRSHDGGQDERAVASPSPRLVVEHRAHVVGPSFEAMTRSNLITEPTSPRDTCTRDQPEMYTRGRPTLEQVQRYACSRQPRFGHGTHRSFCWRWVTAQSLRVFSSSSSLASPSW